MPSHHAHPIAISLALATPLALALPQFGTTSSPSTEQRVHPAPMCGHPRGIDSYFQPNLTWTDICLTTNTNLTFDLHCSSMTVDGASLAQTLDQFDKYASSLTGLAPDYYTAHPVGMTHCVPRAIPSDGHEMPSDSVAKESLDKRQAVGGHAGDNVPKTCAALSIVPAASDSQALTPEIIVDFVKTLESLAGIDKPLQCRFDLKGRVDQETVASGCIAPAEGYVAAKGYSCPPEALNIP